MELIERQNYAIPLRPCQAEEVLEGATTSAPAADSRLEWIDIARGIAILLVMLGHAMSNDNVQHILQPFRMPLFYITAGYLFNVRRHCDALGQYLAARCRRMVVPYFFTAFVFFVFSMIINDGILGRHTPAPFKLFLDIFLGNGAGLNGEAYVLRFNLPLWYLACMTSATLLFIGQIHLFRKEASRVPLVICSLTVALFGYLIGRRLFLPWSFDVAMVAQFFLVIGFLLRENKASFSDRRLFLCLAGAYLGLCLNNNVLDMNRRQFHDFGELFVAGLAGTYMLYYLAHQLAVQASGRAVAARMAAFFRFFGRHTMVIMSCHFGAIYLVELFTFFCFHDPFAASVPPVVVFAAMILTSLLAIAVINRSKRLRAIYYK
jgi:fucose 4-O-acetylase-like acetyltransferase